MGKAVSQRHLQGIDPGWLRLLWPKQKMPAAPVLLEAAASSASIWVPLATAVTS